MKKREPLQMDDYGVEDCQDGNCNTASEDLQAQTINVCDLCSYYLPPANNICKTRKQHLQANDDDNLTC